MSRKGGEIDERKETGKLKNRRTGQKGIGRKDRKIRQKCRTVRLRGIRWRRNRIK